MPHGASTKITVACFYCPRWSS